MSARPWAAAMTSAKGGNNGPRAQAMRPAAVKRARELAARVVRINRDGPDFTLWLATNPGFRPQRIDETLGLPYGEIDGDEYYELQPLDPELQVAELAMSYAAVAAALPRNLKQWTIATAKRAGGNRALAASLVAMEPDLAHTATEQRNMLRKVEEWAQGKYKTPAGRNARRVAALILVTAQSVSLGVNGEWYYVKREGVLDGPHVRWFNTDPSNERQGRYWSYTAGAILAGEGDGFIAFVVEVLGQIIQHYGAVLTQVFALQADVRI